MKTILALLSLSVVIAYIVLYGIPLGIIVTADKWTQTKWFKYTTLAILGALSLIALWSGFTGDHDFVLK